MHLEAQGEADFSTRFKFVIQFPDAPETFRKEIYTVLEASKFSKYGAVQWDILYKTGSTQVAKHLENLEKY